MAKRKGPQKQYKGFTHKSENISTDHWFTTVWRPAMAWAYMVICLFDFIIAPTGTAVLITFYKSTIPVWVSLTTANGGMVHIAFGAILGVAAWGRTRESVANTQSNGFPGQGNWQGTGWNGGGGDQGTYSPASPPPPPCPPPGFQQVQTPVTQLPPPPPGQVPLPPEPPSGPTGPPPT